MNIASNLEIASFHFPENVSLIDNDRQLTYKELNLESSRIASALAETGVAPGDHIAVCLPNSCSWVAVYFGILKAGAVAVTLPYAMTRNELNPVLDDCRPKVLFTDSAKLADIEEKPYIACTIAGQGDLSYETFRNRGDFAFRTVDRRPDETAAILYTGGTTGPPKGVMLTQWNIISAAFNVAQYERSNENDRALCFLPLNHVFAQVHIMNSAIRSAGGIVLQPSFNMDSLIETINRFQVTKFYSVPTVYIRLLSLPDLSEKLRPVRYYFSAAASMASELVREWKSRTGMNVHEAYGMTESASMVTYNHYHRHIIGSVGSPVHGVEIQIRNPQGKVLDTNEPGEICIAGPNIMKGYLNKSAETETAFWGRWFRSGDVGYLDENSYLFIVDRIKDLIITGGENVSPREIEEVLYGRSEIEECAVIGLPDAEYGERVVAYIVPRQGKAIDPDSLKAFLKSHLSPFKVPKKFVTVTELPKSSTGKLLKRELKQQVLNAPDHS